MADICMVPIPKMDVLMEDFTNIETLIDNIASDREKLLEMRNSWAVFFLGYDDDPREIPDIPEVVNWIKKSMEAGIPWFYFMRATQDNLGLVTFMICCGSDHDSDHPGRYIFEKERMLAFIKKNLSNLADFVEKHNIPDEVRCAVTDDIMGVVQSVLQGSMDQKNPSENMDRAKQIKEAMLRLTTLENIYGINPNIKKYFGEGKLYYSYITGGFLGSIDTIDYDKRYVKVVKDFEERTAYLVYHVIECGNTISLLYVSDDYNHWLEERPTSSGVMAQVVNMDTHENEMGFIRVDIIQGALYRSNDTVYSSMPGKDADKRELSCIDMEVVERLEILKNSSIMSDLDIAQTYIREGEICGSLLRSVLGTPVGVVNRVSSSSKNKQLLEMLQAQVPMKLYFMMDSTGNKVAFLSVSEDESEWEYEKLALEKGRAFAVVVDPDERTATLKQISFVMINGGPIFVD
ncbi:MAG: hypothetical protein LUE65_01230 [Clostridiales bacterium]|nr:hypothetical protein [Clostridiales bacterium]